MKQNIKGQEAGCGDSYSLAITERTYSSTRHHTVAIVIMSFLP